MSDLPAMPARRSPSTARNRQPILEVVRARLPAKGLVLEIASGTGEHAAYFAAALPALSWQTSDADFEALESCEAWRGFLGLPNLKPPLTLDAADPNGWPVVQADAMICCNMIHISPWASAKGLMAGAGRVLPLGAPLFLYGPFLEDDVATAPSNLAFDESLKARNPAWGIRRVADVAALAADHGLELAERVEMPANNLTLVFRKVGN
jgi:hypothetical protein